MTMVELQARRPVIPSMVVQNDIRSEGGVAPRRARPAFIVALALSIALHLLWTQWPVEPDVVIDEPVLTATLTEIPPPPVPSVTPPAPSNRAVQKRARARSAPPIITTPAPSPDSAELAQERPIAASERPPETADARPASSASDTITPPREANPPLVTLPPRVDLAYKVFLGTQGFLIGDATYRFEHAGDRYRIATVGQAHGLAALLVRGTGRVESRGRITPKGLRPYEFAVERGSRDRREVAFFDWDAGNVVLHDGATASLEPPAFDPLTVLWQPYFSPPTKDDQTFSLATTRRVTRYTLSLQAEETIAWPQGAVLTERWHRRSDDGKTDAWFWLAPSMHYLPIKMRVTRTSRGTLEVLLDSVRVDDAGTAVSLDENDRIDVPNAHDENAPPRTASDITYAAPMGPIRAEDIHGQ